MKYITDFSNNCIKIGESFIYFSGTYNLCILLSVTDNNIRCICNDEVIKLSNTPIMKQLICRLGNINNSNINKLDEYLEKYINKNKLVENRSLITLIKDNRLFKVTDCNGDELYFGDTVICLLQHHYESKIYIPCKAKVVGRINDKLLIYHSVVTRMTTEVETVESKCLFKVPVGSKYTVNVDKLVCNLFKSNNEKIVKKKLLDLCTIEITGRELEVGNFIYLIPLFSSSFYGGSYGLYLGNNEVFIESDTIIKANRYFCIKLRSNVEKYKNLLVRFKCFSY